MRTEEDMLYKLFKLEMTEVKKARENVVAFAFSLGSSSVNKENKYLKSKIQEIVKASENYYHAYEEFLNLINRPDVEDLVHDFMLRYNKELVKK